MNPTARAFPADFRWGAATAGHQIEGNSHNSDLWFMENIEPRTFRERSGDACDSYHRWMDDIDLLRRLGVNCYRFSVEWARVEPTPGEFSNAAIDHYSRILDELVAAGIDPVVTMFHVAAPRWFAEAGGWLDPGSPERFARYVSRVADALGDRIAYVCTINEPQVGLTYRVVPGAEGYFGPQDEVQTRAHEAATRLTGSERFVTMNHPAIVDMTPQLMDAHRGAVDAVAASRPGLPTGVTLNLVDFQPGNEASRHMELRELAYGAWLDVARESGDFVGVQTYRQIRVPGEGPALPPLPEMPYVDPDDLPEMIKQPDALRNTVEYVHQRTGKPIFVTENGLESDDDERRAWYLPQALGHLHEAIDGGVPVIGYCYWSLLDNFEWLQGFAPHFGLAAVDRHTFERTLKPSSDVYRGIIDANAV